MNEQMNDIQDTQEETMLFISSDITNLTFVYIQKAKNKTKNK